MSEPRICFVAENFYPDVGGIQSQALLLIRDLHQRGYTMTALTLRHSRAWPIHEEVEGTSVVRVAGMWLGLRAHAPRFVCRLLYLLSVLILAGELWRRRRQYDIIHVYQLTILATLSALVCLLAGKRMVVGVRGIGASSVSASDVGGGCAKVLPPINGDLAQLSRIGKFAVYVTFLLLRLAHAVVLVLSTRSIAYLAAYGFSGPQVLLIPNGVDTERFMPAASSDVPYADRTGVVVCVARLVPVKGVDVLLRAWGWVHERAPSARLMLVGNGPLQPRLECLAGELEIRESVEFVGEQQDARPYLRRAAIAVLPSYAEGLSNALLEAMACGLPSVATRVSGSEDVVQQGVNGLLVEPGDAPALADALLTLLGDPARALRCGDAARATIERHYAHERITEQHVELYREIMEMDRRPTRHAQFSISH